MWLFLFAFWMILNANITLEVALIGALAATAVFAFMLKFMNWSVRKEKALYKSLPLLAAYIFALLKDVLSANFATLKVVFGKGPDPVVRVIKTPLKTSFGRAILANSITLTPGTLTMELKEDELIVHCLTPGMADGLKDMRIEKILLRIEGCIHG